MGTISDALNRLLESGAINARKYGLNTADNRDYQKGKDNEATFFYTGTFYLKKTPYSKPYLEQIEEPPEPEKRRIGF
jgi:hypothetical protein